MLLPAESGTPVKMRADAATLPLLGGHQALYEPQRSTAIWTEERRRAWHAAARRGLNVIIASMMVLLLAPLMVLIGVLIKLSSPGPILYTQARVGVDRRWNRLNNTNHRRVVDHGGKLFRIYKFRTMYVNPEGRMEQRWAAKNDPRVTPVGRFLRRYRLDELPQLYNVLVGDMNIVGPRPEQPKIFAHLRTEIPNYGARQRVLPGITGLAQVNQPYDTCAEDVKRKVQLDLAYIERESLLEDVKILLYTLPAVVVKRGGW